MAWVKCGAVVSIVVIGGWLGDHNLTYAEIWMLSMLTSLYIDRMAERADGRYKE